jgi:hypothetical protein
MLISAPCGTATNCTVKGGVNAIEIFIKGNYSASLTLESSKVEGGVFAHDEFNSNPDIVNNGTLSLTVDAATTGVSKDGSSGSSSQVVGALAVTVANSDNKAYINTESAVNADELGVNPSNIVISGSSAGAITVMQAEYELCNRTSWAEVLPKDFRYAGVMSFSGAILSRKGEVKYASAPAPTLMLHGTADNLVNYKQIKFFNLGFFGGGKLVKRFEKFGYNYNMYHFIGYGHEIAGSMDTTLDLQLDFIETNVIEGKRRIVEAWVDDPNVYKGVGVQSRKELYSK